MPLKHPRLILTASTLAASLLAGGCTVTLWGPGPTGNAGNAGNSGNSGNSGTGSTAKVGLADKSFKLDGKTDAADVVDVWAGTYPVAIFATPEGESGHIGPASFEVTRDGRVVSMALLDSSGKLIRKSAVSLDSDDWAIGKVQVQHSASQLIVDETAAKHRRMLGQFGNGHVMGPDGQVGGQAGVTGGDIFHFRNNVEYVGPAVPEALKHLAGTWKGPSEATLHGTNDVTVTITADGKVTVSGIASLNGKEATVSSTWDGHDDYIAPHPTQAGDFQIVLDSQKGGGSQPEGGIALTVPALDTLKDAPAIKRSRSGLAGMQGDLTVNAPTKQ